MLPIISISFEGKKMKILNTIISSFLLSLIHFNLLAQSTPQAKIQSLKGNVELIEKEGAPAKPAQPDMAVFPSNFIKTESHSYCVVELDSDNTIRIKQNAHVKIEKLWEESQAADGSVVKEVRLNLLKGELNAKLKKLPSKSKFNVTGPVAIAGAAGTTYTVSVDPDKQETGVTVLDHEVLVESIHEPNKSIRIQKFQRVDAAPWSNTSLTAMGRGVLSEAILGKTFALDAEQNIHIQAIGTGKTTEEAKILALHRLSKTILQLRVNEEKNLEGLMTEDQELTQKVYRTITKAQTLDSPQNADESFQVKAQINVTDLNQALGYSLYGMTQSVRSASPSYNTTSRSSGRL
jgi:hypothetical protein